MSYLAFTATPKNTTLEIFGTRESVDTIPHPFHEYSMRQAVEEGFILDVLQNYRTYKSYYELEKTIEDDPRFKGSKAKRKVARYVSLTTINQKAAVIVEHFNKHVKNELNGQAKAMVVCQSREHAFKHYEAIKGYIKDHKDECKGLDAIIAFSGDLIVDGQSYTEPGLNGFAEKDLPEQFDTNLYQVLVVANKYQTGFDQPKICAMYIDRKLDGLQAVKSYCRFYSFIVQVYPVADVKLESLYWYATWLSKKLKNNKADDGPELTDEMIRLTKLRIEEKENGSATPGIGEITQLPPITAFGVNTKPSADDEKELSEIIKEFNDKHGTSFTEDDIIRIGIQAEKVANEMSAVIKNNPVDVSLDTFADRLFDKMAELRETEKDLDNIMTSDQDSWRRLASVLLRANKGRLETGLGL